MNQLIINDNPILNPDDDLLGMKQPAQTLADYLKTVKPPFILGVYGPWGEGKTSFVELMRYHLAPEPDPKVAFITLQAWPYTTSDELWRALILSITDELCKKPPPDPNTPLPKAAPSGWLAAILSFLESPALPLYQPEEPQVQEESCQKLRNRLDKSSGHSISRQADNQMRINQQAALSAVVGGVVEALSTVSPLVAGLRRLLKGPPQPSYSELFQEQKSKTIEQSVKSVQELQRDFKRIFSEISANKRVYVFIDDLDRCLPNVALDLLEAIRNFLQGLNCVFIITADENLIGQGLRLRYKELFQSGNPRRTEVYLNQKGQEFFEKIIQFGVRIPARTQEQTHKFITGQFPQWAPASDIMQTAIGDNPRRLKQYCNLLTFKFDVSQGQSQAIFPKALSVDEATLTRFHNLIRVYSRDRVCRDYLVELASNPANYQEYMAKVEQWLELSKNDQRAKGAKEELPKGACWELFDRVVASEPLLVLFCQKDRFSQWDSSLIVTLGSLADIHPDPTSTFQTQDRLFMRLLPKAVLNLPLNADDILQSDFTKLMRLREKDSGAFVELVKLAQEHQWKEMPELEAFLSELSSFQRTIQRTTEAKEAEIVVDRGEEAHGNKSAGADKMAQPASTSPSQLSELFKELVAKLPESVRPLGEFFLKPSDGFANRFNKPLVDLFLDPPLFSAILPEETLLFHEQQRMFDPAQVQVSVYQNASMVSSGSQVVGVAMQNLTNNKLLEEVRHAIGARIDIAQSYLALREFAKLDLLNFKWPLLAEEVRRDAEVIMRLEALFLEKADIPEDLQPLYLEAKKDKTLVTFLGLRPLFVDMKELRSKVAVAKNMPEKVEAPEALQVKAAESVKVAEEIKKVALQEVEPAKALELYQNFSLKIAPSKDGAPLYTIRLTDGNGESAEDEMRITPEEIDKRFLMVLPRLGQFAFSEVARTAAQDGLPMTRALTRSGPADYTQIVQDFGLTLYNWFFRGENHKVEKLFSKSMEEHTRLRLLLDIAPGAFLLNALPWESLYVPHRDIYLGKNERYSLVRLVSTPSVRNDLLSPLKPPLRVLALLSSPQDMPAINIQGEAKVLQETMHDPIKDGNMELNILTHVTVESLQMALVRYRPDFVHFVGHGFYDREKQKGFLLVEDAEGMGRALDSENMKNLLSDQSVRTVVLNGCHTGSAEGSRDVTTSIAGMLVEAGVPLVVATMREVRDDAALLFSRAFYRMLAAGAPIEAALAQSRKRLELESFDWTVYALYASTSRLDQVMLLPRRR